MSTTPHASRAVLRLKKTATLVLLAAARAIYTGMLADPARFPNPLPTLVLFLAQIATLDAQQAAAMLGSRVATAARNVARDIVWDSLLSLRAYVQVAANTDAVNSVAIITAAGFEVARPYARVKPVLAATLPGTPGLVNLVANAKVLTGGSRRRPTFIWQYSLDGGHTWLTLPPTPKANTTVSGLPLMTYVSFRVSVTMDVTQEPWSQAVSIPVH